MLSKVFSYGLSGLDAYPVTIEVDVSPGLPSTIIVGLPDNAVKESKERVRAAIKNSGYKYKPQRITVNLSPADIKKEGPSFDLAIAIGILAATDQMDGSRLKDYVLLGEVSLDGHIHSIQGALSVSLSVKADKFKGLIVPQANAAEAAVTETIPVYPVKTLNEVVHLLTTERALEPFRLTANELLGQETIYAMDFSDVKGQLSVKRGLEIAAAGGHNCLLLGPPGSGKTMLAKRVPTILPAMTITESLETTRIHSAAGTLLPQTGLIRNRPFRSPHHTSSDVSLVGGGTIPRPGEISLSHNGVLFLDELPEFNRNVLESLRQPLEDHCVTISRISRAVRFPAKFMLIASMNPCPCGYFTDPKKECHCSPLQIQRYHSKISGPLLDRIDIHLEVPALRSHELLSFPESENSTEIRKRTSLSRQIQQERFKGTTIFANSQMGQKEIRKFCQLTKEGNDLLKSAVEQIGLSARGHDKVLKVARTISDLEGSETILPSHLCEAIQYRTLDRGWGK